jgi:hypothetical protein
MANTEIIINRKGYKIHTFLSGLTDCMFGYTASLTFGSAEFIDIMYKNVFPTS